jgi:hypothetical protein
MRKVIISQKDLKANECLMYASYYYISKLKRPDLYTTNAQYDVPHDVQPVFGLLLHCLGGRDDVIGIRIHCHIFLTVIRCY